MDVMIDDIEHTGRGPQFMAALVASLIEHLGERNRSYLRLPPSRPQPEQTT
jgi:hypothetical protein